MKADPTIWRTPNQLCAACKAKRLHTNEELNHHPFSRHGYERGRWTDPMLDPLPPLELHGECDPEENK